MAQALVSPRRVTVVAPHTRADVALPVEATVAEVLQQLTRLMSVDAEDPTGSSGGWLLTRLGREPFDEEQLVAASGIRDGDLLYLTSRRSRLPAVVFDDVVDAIASAAESSDRWGPAGTRRAALAGGLACTIVGLVALLSAGPPWGLPSLVAAALALLLLLGAASLAHALAEPALAAGVAGVAVAYGAVAGLLALAGDARPARLGSPQLLLACAAVLAGCVLSVLVLRRLVAAFVGTALAAALGVGATTWAAVWGERADRVAAVTVAVTLIGQPLLSVLALHLARVPFPRLPATAREFRRTRPVPLDADVLEQTRRADEALTALVAATCAVILVLVVVLLLTPDAWSRLLGLVVTFAVLVRSRHAELRWERVALLTAAGTALAVAALAALARSEVSVRIAAATVAVGLGAGAVAYARMAPGRSPSPYWGRTLDVVELVLVGSVVPLVVAVFDGYAAVRGIAG